MRQLRAGLAAFVFWLALSGTVLAACAELKQVTALASDGFTSGTHPDARTLALLRQTITQTNNDDMLRLLQRSGQAGSFGHLRNFLTELQFIAQSAEGQRREATAFQRDLARAIAIVDIACTYDAGQAAKDFQPVTSQSPPQGIGLVLQRVRTSAVAAHDRLFGDTYKLAVLGQVLTLLGVLVTAAFAGHFGFIALRTIYRGRSLCDVPIKVAFLAQETEARITIIGRYGCRIVSQDGAAQTAMLALKEGTYCRLIVADHTLNGRIMYDTVTQAGALFAAPLSRAELRGILAHSDVPPRYDFSFLRDLRARKQVFGLGSLPRP